MIRRAIEDRDEVLFREYERLKGLTEGAVDVDPDRGRRESRWHDLCRLGLTDRILASYAERAPDLWSADVLRAARWVWIDDGRLRPSRWTEVLREAGWVTGEDGRWRKEQRARDDEADSEWRPLEPNAVG